MRAGCYLTRRVVTDTCARASKLGRCAIRVCALCASCAKGVEHQARIEQRHVIAVFTHGRFHACTRKTIILQHSGPDALRCAVLQHRSDAAFHRDPARATRTTQAQLAPHSRDHSLSVPVNLQLLRCEHDETDRVAPSGALLWTRGWHPKPIMLHGARKADSPPKFKKASPSLTFAQGSNGTPHATSPRGSQPAPDTRM